MAKSRPQRDILNEPIILARNMAYQSVQALLNNTPNPIGETDSDRIPTRMSLAELKRLAGRE